MAPGTGPGTQYHGKLIGNDNANQLSVSQKRQMSRCLGVMLVGREIDHWNYSPRQVLKISNANTNDETPTKYNVQQYTVLSTFFSQTQQKYCTRTCIIPMNPDRV